MADGPTAGLALAAELAATWPTTTYCRPSADPLRRLGRLDEAADAYRRALGCSSPGTGRRYLERRLAEVTAGPG